MEAGGLPPGPPAFSCGLTAQALAPTVRAMGSYNQFAGRDIDRLAALSDGLFAVAMTLIVLEVHVPPGD
jgi:Endosomal/lysosomal potassium channel TMEM175